MDIDGLLATAVEHNASDLHVSAGLPPMIRVDGDLQRLEQPQSLDGDVSNIVAATVTEAQRAEFQMQGEVDYAYVAQGVGRFRVNAYMHDRGTGVVFRVIPNHVPTLNDLDAPDILSQLARLPRGLVLVTGPTGSGKSTTLAAMVDEKNRAESGHILTIEDPIEFLHAPKQCLINQRQVHRDTTSFSAALRGALREDPDTILVGELRDLETIRLALTAAETGHLVLATVHTRSAPKTINRLVDVFPGNEQAMIRGMLSESLQAVVAQTLLKRVGGGRVAAHEIMVANAAVRNLIREGRVAQMYSAMQTGQAAGMQTLEQSLNGLVRQGLVAPEQAEHTSDRSV